jgi:hypothetical protein
MEFAALGLAYVSCGNWLSVKQPFRMQFYRFSAGGSPVDALLGVIFGSVPGALTVYLLAREDPGAPWKIGIMVIVYLAVSLFSVSRFGRLLETRREEIRRSLS